MKTDIEIAQASKLLPIAEVAGRLGIPDEALEPYGRYKAKVSLDWLATQPRRADGRLVLVSAISPTPAGEGKTTTTVGLTDALNRMGRRTIACLREPYPLLQGAPSGHVVNIREVRLAAGAEFVVIVCGDVMTMPGLPKDPSAARIDIDDAGRITGLF